MNRSIVHSGFNIGALHVWLRNFLYFRQTIWISFFWIILEPVFMLFAIGYGLGSLGIEVNGQAYIQFYAPGLMVGTSMMVSYYEATYGTFTRFFRQKTFHTMMLTPITPSEIVLGEIMWAATKGLLSSLAIALVASLFGIINFFYIFYALPILILNCWVFSAFGLLMSSYAKSFDSFMYSQTALITPMFMLCGIFFPIDQLPFLIKELTFLLPLTHSILAVREIFSGILSSSLFLNLAVLFAFSFGLTHWATTKFTKRLYS